MSVQSAIRHEADPDLVHRSEDGHGWCRVFPARTHSKLGEELHRGALMMCVDMALVATCSACLREAVPAR